MNEIKHGSAIYFDEFSNRKEITAESLGDLGLLAFARQQELFDVTEQISLAPRVSTTGVPHFYEIGAEKAKRTAYEGESDPTHNRRVAELTEGLQKLSDFRWDIKIKGKNAAGDDVETFESLGRFPKYLWGSEVHRILTSSAVVRQDVFGQSFELAMSAKRPYIAIEVINTHYPAEEAFKAMIEASRNIPMVVLFDMTERPNTFVKIDVKNKRLQMSKWTFYIKNGGVWQNQQLQKAITSSAMLKLSIEELITRWTKFHASAPK